MEIAKHLRFIHQMQIKKKRRAGAGDIGSVRVHAFTCSSVVAVYLKESVFRFTQRSGKGPVQRVGRHCFSVISDMVDNKSRMEQINLTVKYSLYTVYNILWSGLCPLCLVSNCNLIINLGFAGD